MHVGGVHVCAFAEVSDRRGVHGGGVHVCELGCSASELPSCI